MTKQECIDFMIEHRFLLIIPEDSKFRINERKLMDEYITTHEGMDFKQQNNAFDAIHFNGMYDYLKESGFLEVSEVKKIDSKKILIVAEGSCDISALESMGFEVIKYNQGSIAPALLK